MTRVGVGHLTAKGQLFCQDDKKYLMLLSELMDKVEERHGKPKLKNIVSLNSHNE